MATLNLTATNRQEEIIKQYLEENANETLTEKINNGIKTEKDGKYVIDPNKCIDCGSCASVCPVGAPDAE